MELLQEIVIRIFHTTNLINDVHYKIYGFIQTPFLNVIQIKPHTVSASTFTTKKLENDVKMIAGLSKTDEVVIDVHRGFVTIEIPRPASERGQTIYTLDDIPHGRGLRVPLGLDILGMPTYHDFGRHMQTNLGFLGVPGSGKSISMRAAIVSLARNNNPGEVRFLMLEVAKDGLDLRIFGRLPHLIHPVITDPDEAIQALAWAVEQIRMGKLPFKLFVCVDEVAALVRQRPEAIDLLMALVAEGRGVGIVNLLATQIIDDNALGKDGPAIFRQVHNRVLGKATNKQLSYLLGNQSGLKAEALTGEGDLLLNSNTESTRFAGIFTTRRDMESLPRVDNVNRLPIQNFTNTDAAADDAKALVRSGQFEEKPIPPAVIGESLISLQRQIDDPIYRRDMRGRAYYVLPASQVNEIGRNKATFKERDQPYIVEIYKYLRRRGVQLCLPGK